jgi:hypothetical protein
MHTTSSLAVAGGATASPVSKSLDSAHRVVEGRFLEAGEVLGQAVEGVGKLIKSLDQLTSTMNPATVAAMTGELEAAAASLLSLPTQHAGRRAIIERLTHMGDDLAGCIDDMRRNLAYLRVFAINIKITAGGVSAAGEEFGHFSQEICDRIERGRVELLAFEADLNDLRGQLGTALTHEQTLAQHCEGLLPVVPDGLIATAAEMVAHNQKVSQVAVEVAGLARNIQKKVGAALGALQIGDITRQRIEHVQQGLDRLSAVKGLETEPRARLEAFIHGLLAAQLRATADDFHRNVTRIGENMSGMATDATELLRLRELAFGRSGGDGDGFLRRMESHVGQALDLVDHVEKADLVVVDVGRSAGAAASDLSARINGLQTIKVDVQQMALNTTLKCSRMGDTGKPLAVIAVELRLYAGHLDSSAHDALSALAGLAQAAGALSGESGETAAASEPNAGIKLSEAAARLRSANNVIEADLADLARQGDALVEDLRRAAGRLDFRREIGAILEQAADALTEMAGAEQPYTDDLGAPLDTLLAEIAKSYTMAQEREVHRAHTAELVPQAAAA